MLSSILCDRRPAYAHFCKFDQLHPYHNIEGGQEPVVENFRKPKVCQDGRQPLTTGLLATHRCDEG